MRKIVLLFPTVFFIFLSSAQTPITEKPKPSIGIKTGLNISKLRLTGNGSSLLECDFRTGFVAGAFAKEAIRNESFLFQNLELCFVPE